MIGLRHLALPGCVLGSKALIAHLAFQRLLLSFKLGLVACATSVMFLHRRLPLTEWMAALVLVALIYVALRWINIYELYDVVFNMAPPGYRVHGGGF